MFDWSIRNSFSTCVGQCWFFIGHKSVFFCADNSCLLSLCWRTMKKLGSALEGSGECMRIYDFPKDETGSIIDIDSLLKYLYLWVRRVALFKRNVAKTIQYTGRVHIYWSTCQCVLSYIKKLTSIKVRKHITSKKLVYKIYVLQWNATSDSSRTLSIQLSVNEYWSPFTYDARCQLRGKGRTQWQLTDKFVRCIAVCRFAFVCWSQFETWACLHVCKRIWLFLHW